MLSDFCIGILGLGVVWLYQIQRRKLASILGLMAQPFWLYTAYQASLWGIFVVCIMYTALYIKGIISD